MGERTRARNGDLDAVPHRPVPNLPPVDRMPEPTAKLARRKGVRIPLRLPARAGHPPEKPLLLVRPRFGMVSDGKTGRPLVSGARRTGGRIGRLEFVEPGLPYLKILHRLFARDGTCRQLHDRVAHMGDTQPVCHLLFHGAYHTPGFRFCPPHRRPAAAPHGGRSTSSLPLSILSENNLTSDLKDIPLLLSTAVRFCFHRDTKTQCRIEIN